MRNRHTGESEVLQVDNSRTIRERLIRRQQLLEDQLFRRIRPDAYAGILRFVERHGAFRRSVLVEMADMVESKLEPQGVLVLHVEARVKHLYSIYRKVQRTGKPLSEIYDLLGIRLVCETEADCYAALEVVHRLYRPEMSRFKDYIAHPKENGYRSIHTTVVHSAGVSVEFQIRTLAMHLRAEPEHGDYKHGDYKRGDYKQEGRCDETG